MDSYHAAISQKTLQKTLKHLTTRPGCYLYKDAGGKIIYVGKAKNLKNRVRQYFGKRDALTRKTQLLVDQIKTIETIPTDSEFDALLLEATLIRNYQPKYNAIAKDDKSPLYIVITLHEDLPRILIERKHSIDTREGPFQNALVIGPFQSGRIIRQLLRSIRRIIPFCLQKRRDGRACFYTHLGLCNPCPCVLSSRDDRLLYRKNISRIALLLSGKSRMVRSILEKEMADYASSLAFEKAQDIKRQLDALDMLILRAFDPMIYIEQSSLPDNSYGDRLDALAHILKMNALTISRPKRIECIDISTISGDWATGSLVVFTDGVPDTGQYRRFRIKIAGKPNDVGMMREVIFRRFRHPEWPTPDLLVVDGGKPQVRASQAALGNISMSLPLIGLAKRFEEIVIPLGNTFHSVRLVRSSPALQLLQHIRDEAHRFAKRYHTRLRSRLLQ